MAIKYQKADRVAGTSEDGKNGEKIFAEKYNKLARAFNDRLSYGIGDTTWRIFFYAHSMFRSMVLPKFDSGDKWAAKAGINVVEPEDGWWKVYSHIIPEPAMFDEDGYKDKDRNDTHMFAWPKDNVANKFGGPNPSNHLVSYIFGTAGGTVDSFKEEGNLPPEWFRTQLVKLELDFANTQPYSVKKGALKWFTSTGDLLSNPDGDITVSPVDSFVLYDSVLNPSNDENAAGGGGSHAPKTLSEMWLMAKIQRGVVVPQVNLDLDLFQYKAAMTHAAAPAYMTARWYYDYYVHWRSPFGKNPPSYSPTPEVVDLCPQYDERFPPAPVHEYIFSPINPKTHDELRFKTSCGGWEPEKLENVRREYDHYLLIFADGHFTDPLTNERKIGNLKLSYKHYYEGPYTGGGRLGKREVNKDQIDSVLNFYNSGFRKHMSSGMSKEIFSRYLVEKTERKTSTTGEFEKRYESLADATFDVPTWGFEFEKFFEKQYSLAPAYGQVYWQDSWEKGEGEHDMLYEPTYPTFATANSTNIEAPINAGSYLNLYSHWIAPEVLSGELQGPYGENNFSLNSSFIDDMETTYFPKPVPEEDIGEQWKHYCFAGFYIVGCGIKLTTQPNGTLSPRAYCFDRKIVADGVIRFDIETYKHSDINTPTWTPNSPLRNTLEYSATLTPVPGSGYCSDDPDKTKEECHAAGGDWIEEGVFEKLYYFAKGEDVVLADRVFSIKLVNDITLMAKPVESDGVYTRDEKTSSNSWSGICMETAILLRMRPDLPDALLMTRLASSGLGSDRANVEMKERWGGDDDTKISSAITKGIDTKGDMMFSTLKKDGTPDITKAPKKIWQNYENYGIIKNLFGQPNLPHKMGDSVQQDNAMKDTYLNLMLQFASGQDVSSQNYINFNPIYDSAREMFHRNLRMIPRTSLVDYKYIYDEKDYVCKYTAPETTTLIDDTTETQTVEDSETKVIEKPEIENTLECAKLGDGHSWSKGRTKSVLTFNRYVDLYGDPNLPEVEGMYKADLDDDPKVGDRIAPSP